MKTTYHGIQSHSKLERSQLNLGREISVNSDRIRRPSSQFYWADHFRDPALRACSLAAQGLWMLMLDLMHQCEPYGHLTLGGAPESTPQLARQVGESPTMIRKLLSELEANGVFSRTDQGVIYSRRMVRDEHLRTVRAEAGRLGGNPNLKREKDNPGVSALVKQTSKQNLTPSSSSSSSSSSSPAAVVGNRRTDPSGEESTAQSNGANSSSPRIVLPQQAEKFLAQFYEPTSTEQARKRYRDVQGQLYEVLDPLHPGPKIRGGTRVKARSVEHLADELRAVMRDPPPDRDLAIVWLLKKLLDPPKGPSVTEVKKREEGEARALEERYSRAAKAAGIQWEQDHPQEYDAILRAVDKNYQGARGDWTKTAKEAELTQRCAKAAGFPTFEEWRERATEPRLEVMV